MAALLGGSKSSGFFKAVARLPIQVVTSGQQKGRIRSIFTQKYPESVPDFEALLAALRYRLVMVEPADATLYNMAQMGKAVVVNVDTIDNTIRQASEEKLKGHIPC